jgi:hypothetical protein
MGLLSKSELRLEDIVAGYSVSSARASTYDLRIGCVIDSAGKVHDREYTLKPQEVAWVISEEILTLPSHITAMAHIKTGLCNEGLLALNTGMVDPLWSGPLSTPMLNFGKASHLLKTGDQFLRLTFHGHAPEEGIRVTKSAPNYISEKRTEAIHYFGEKFLDANAILKEALNANIFKYASVIGLASGIFVAVVAGVLTLGAIIINSNAFYAPTYYSTHYAPALAADRDTEKRLTEIEKAIRSLKGE